MPTKRGDPASRPSAARWQSLAVKKPPVKPGALDVEQLENARPVVGEHPDQPLVFPLHGNSANALPPPPSQGSQNLLSSQWHPKPAAGGSSVPGFDRLEKKPLVYEDIFKYLEQGSGALQSPVGPPQAAGGSSQGSSSGHTFPQKQLVKGGAWLFQPSKPVYLHRYQTPWKRSAKVYWHVPPPSYLIQSSNGYQRFSKSYTNVKYDPEFAALQAKGDPALQPAAPAHFQGPQRYSHGELT